MQAHRKEKDGWRLPAQQIESIILNEVTALLRRKVSLLDLCGLRDCNPEKAQLAISSGAALADAFESTNPEDIRQRLQSLINRIELQPDAVTLRIDRGD